jgi:uncharacterized protein
MTMRTLRGCTLILLALLSSASLFAQPAVPALQQRVTDFTNSLNFNEWRTLESRLKQFEDSTSTEVAILLINSLEGEALEDYSMKVFEKNKIGKKGKDNGVLIFVAKADHCVRIEVGYGLEGVLTDAATSQIVEREIKPYFKANNFYAGLSAGVQAIIAASAGEYKVEPRGKSAPMISVILALFFFGFMGAFILPMMAGRRRYLIHSSGTRYLSGWGWPYSGFGGGGGSFGGGGGWSGGGGMAGGGGASGSW